MIQRSFSEQRLEYTMIVLLSFWQQQQKMVNLTDRIFVVRILQHPGGPELVLEYAGKECTKAYDDAGHSQDANRILKKYRIGVLHKETSRKSIIDVGNIEKVIKRKRKWLLWFCA